MLFGGRSAEHDVSLMSASFVFEALTRAGAQVVLIGIGRDGVWRHCPGANAVPETVPEIGGEVTLAPGRGGQLFSLDPSAGAVPTLDAVFPVLHGPFGEDGTIQGLLEIANVPFVGAGVLGSAVAMDKDVAKRLLRDAGLPIPRFIACALPDVPDFEAACAVLDGAPLFVKPARLGSSVGVSKAEDAGAFDAAVALAGRYDDKILIEAFVPAREIECAVLDTGTELIASVPGEIVPAIDRHGFYSYEAKYLDPSGAALVVPADLPATTAEQVRALALKVFRVLGCAGMARIDFFLHKTTGEVLVNEANTIPGFTAISMYPRLMEASGVAGPELVATLVDQAVRTWRRRHGRGTA
ncbi:MAG TPA: D-alanine--D-alanine ligase family protein [Candidatus Sulfotelmatobacter sp.]|nr:D-alanine--D-alanine ligase family protein [Candidatus Sulfotelmatobacter sp.]